MKIDEKLENKVISYLCGEDTLPIIHLLKGKYNVSEFDIAEALNLDLNVMRNQLYRLQQYNLLKFKRKKDKQKGWYIYYWTPDLSNIPYLYLKILKEQLARVESRLKREKNNFFFSCQNQCMRLSFEQAMDFNFICPECGLIMDEVKNDAIIAELEQKRNKLIREIDEFENKVIPEWKRKQTTAPEKELPKKRRSKRISGEGEKTEKKQTAKKTRNKKKSKEQKQTKKLNKVKSNEKKAKTKKVNSIASNKSGKSRKIETKKQKRTKSKSKRS